MNGKGAQRFLYRTPAPDSRNYHLLYDTVGLSDMTLSCIMIIGEKCSLSLVQTVHSQRCCFKVSVGLPSEKEWIGSHHIDVTFIFIGLERFRKRHASLRSCSSASISQHTPHLLREQSISGGTNRFGPQPCHCKPLFKRIHSLFLPNSIFSYHAGPPCC